MLVASVLPAAYAGSSPWSLGPGTALVTGGSKGIGRAIVDEFLEQVGRRHLGPSVSSRRSPPIQLG